MFSGLRRMLLYFGLVRMLQAPVFLPLATSLFLCFQKEIVSTRVRTAILHNIVLCPLQMHILGCCLLQWYKVNDWHSVVSYVSYPISYITYTLGYILKMKSTGGPFQSRTYWTKIFTFFSIVCFVQTKLIF